MTVWSLMYGFVSFSKIFLTPFFQGYKYLYHNLLTKWKLYFDTPIYRTASVIVYCEYSFLPLYHVSLDAYIYEIRTDFIKTYSLHVTSIIVVQQYRLHSTCDFCYLYLYKESIVFLSKIYTNDFYRELSFHIIINCFCLTWNMH